MGASSRLLLAARRGVGEVFESDRSRRAQSEVARYQDTMTIRDMIHARVSLLVLSSMDLAQMRPQFFARETGVPPTGVVARGHVFRIAHAAPPDGNRQSLRT